MRNGAKKTTGRKDIKWRQREKKDIGSVQQITNNKMIDNQLLKGI
jgi:hypothetical protein